MPINSIIEYSITNAAITKFKNEYSGLEITDSNSYKVVVKAIATIRGLRISVEKKRKELKADSLEWGRNVDSEAKRIAGLLSPIEDKLKATKKVVDDERIRVEKERTGAINDKILEIQKMGLSIGTLSVQALQEIANKLTYIEIEEDEYQEFFSTAREIRYSTYEKIKVALHARIKFEKEEADRKIEAERLKIQKSEQDAAQKKIDEANQKIEADRKKVEGERLKFEEDKKAEQERKEREALEAQKRENQKKLEKQKAIEKQERIELQKKRAEELKPDTEKLEEWANKLLSIDGPECTDQAAQGIVSECLQEIYAVASSISLLIQDRLIENQQ